MTYVRVTRDQRGYENTFLLHSPRPGEPARVLYWYRSAPGVRVGRAALDEDAIRGIEEQHPEIEFDWPQLIEEASTATPEIERRPERRRRPVRSRDDEEDRGAADTPPAEPIAPEAPAEVMGADEAIQEEPAARPPAARVESVRNPLLEQLVGREIAERLRARYAEIASRLEEQGQEDASRAALRSRAEALDPDRWMTMEAVLHGVEHADRLWEELRREL